MYYPNMVIFIYLFELGLLGLHWNLPIKVLSSTFTVLFYNMAIFFS